MSDFDIIRRSILLSLCCCLATVACLAADPAPPEIREIRQADGIYQLGIFEINVNEITGEFSIIRLGEKILGSAETPFIEEENFFESVCMMFGFFDFDKLFRRVMTYDRFLGIEVQQGSLILKYKAPYRRGKRVSLSFALEREDILRCELYPEGPLPGTAYRIKFECGDDDRFLGFGEQYNSTDKHGEVLPIWVSEQGVGRSENPLFPWIGEYYETYFPMPYFMNRGYGFLHLSPCYSVFDLGAGEPGVWNLEVWDEEGFPFLIFGGPDPVNIIEQLTSVTGRSLLPPKWSFEPWLAVEGGAEVVREVMDVVVDNAIPVSAIWCNDWVGHLKFPPFYNMHKYHWVVDETLFPDLPGLIEEMHGRGFRFLGYFNPFVVPKYEHYWEGVSKGYLVKDRFGLPYLSLFSHFLVAQVDLTNPEACDWVRGYLEDALEMGMDGWMADFGEWLPYDASLASGVDPRRYHNLYPTAWHALNRSVLEEYRPDGDFVMFTRSGFTGESGVAQIVWAGDQQCDWSEGDGIRTVVPAGLNLGLSGIPYFTHDIAGFSGGPSTKELYLRWTELGAFSPIMRTHRGIHKGNWDFRTDEETLAHFKFYARIHAQLALYIYEYAEAAAETGLPIMRHTAYLYPDDPVAWRRDHQFFLGDDFLVAPVLDDNHRKRELYLPEGTWYSIWTGEPSQGPGAITVPAPLGEIPVFTREPLEEFMPELHDLIRNR